MTVTAVELNEKKTEEETKKKGDKTTEKEKVKEP